MSSGIFKLQLYVTAHACLTIFMFPHSAYTLSDLNEIQVLKYCQLLISDFMMNQESQQCLILHTLKAT